MDEFETLVFGGSSQSELPALGIVEFNEQAYRQAFPDVETAVAAGQASSALDHYARVGRRERRLETAGYLRILAGGQQERASHGQLSFNVDTTFISDSGAVFVVGWSDDRLCPLLSISVIQGSDGWNTGGVARCRRPDVEGLLETSGTHGFGFWILHEGGGGPECDLHPRRGPVMLRARFADGRFCQTEAKPRRVTDAALREIVLGHFANLEYLGNRDIEAFAQLDTGAGAAIVVLNRRITESITAGAHIDRFGPRRERFAASFIVCLFGKAEYFFLQNALFATGAGAAEIEFV